jgi:Skp family chaperone for outer membrane proteins
VAYINVQQIANESAQGRVSSQRVQQLNERKVQELADQNKQLQASQQKLQQSGSVLSDAARVQLEREIERIQLDLQRATEDAQAEVRVLQEELQADFQQRLMPIIQDVATEMDLHMIFSQLDAGLVWANPGLDITGQVIARFDEANPAQPAASSAPPQP